MFARTRRLLLRPGFPEDAHVLAEAIADQARGAVTAAAGPTPSHHACSRRRSSASDGPSHRTRTALDERHPSEAGWTDMRTGGAHAEAIAARTASAAMGVRATI